MFLWFFKIFGNLWVFGNLRKFSEKFGNGSKVIFICFYDFLKFLENLRKSSEIVGNKFRTWSEMVRSSLLRSPQMDTSKLLSARNDGKLELNTTRCILPIAHRRICDGNPGLSLAVFFKAWDKIQNNTTQYNSIQHNTMQYNTIQNNTTRCNTTQHNTVQSNAIQHNALQHNKIQYNKIQ